VLPETLTYRQPARICGRTVVRRRSSLHALVAGRSSPKPDASLRRAAIESRVSLYWPAPRNTPPGNSTSIRLVAPTSIVTGRRLAPSLNDEQQEGSAPRARPPQGRLCTQRCRLKSRRNAYAHASTSTCGNLGKARLLASLPAPAPSLTNAGDGWLFDSRRRSHRACEPASGIPNHWLIDCQGSESDSYRPVVQTVSSHCELGQSCPAAYACLIESSRACV
jgi:hypothetical protein